jgi:hypothetical protein
VFFTCIHVNEKLVWVWFFLNVEKT